MTIKVDPEIISGFVKEVESYLPKLGRSIEEFRSNPDRLGNLEEAYRMVHCIRGAGSTIGLFALSQIAQYQEDALEQLLSGELTWSEQVAQVLQAATLRIGDYLRGITSGHIEERPIVTEVVRAFRRMRNLPEEDDGRAIETLLSGSEALPPALSPAQEPPSVEMQTLDEIAVDDDLWAAFQEEAAEHFTRIAGGLAQLEAGPDENALQTVRRSVHQLKGASGVVGLRTTSKVNGGMQKILDRILDGEAAYSPELLPLFEGAFEVVLESVGGRGAGANLADRAASVLAGLDRVLAAPARTPAFDLAVEDRVEADDELWQAFHQEAEEHLHSIGELLRLMERQTPELETIQSMRRSVHTLKGACGVVGLRLTSAVAHRMEDLLDALYEGRLAFQAHLTPLLFKTSDILSDAVAARALSPAQKKQLPELFAGYDEALRHASPLTREPRDVAPEKPADLEEASRLPVETPAPVPDHEPAPAPSRKSGQFVRAPLERVDDLVRLVSELVIHRSRFEQHLSSYIHEVGELQLSTERLSRISRRLQSDYEAVALQEANRRLTFASMFGRPASASAEQFDALEFDRYTEFHLLSRDLAETASDVTNAGSRLNELITDFDGYLNRLGALTGDVEDRLMRLRMLPLRNISARLHRTVRVTAERRNKRVDLHVEGEAVELDKTVLEEIAGPLDHILRNAVDHGIEPASSRRAAGKREAGVITLRAYHEGTQVVLQIKDDGAGLDPARLRQAAVRMGYVSEHESHNVSDQELFGLIFLPGFSTASELSEVSGRGVGLDVVKVAVSKMKGTLSVTSERGRGTTFTIRLPMTLALTRVVLVKSANETYAIPLGGISQILRIEPEQLERVGRKLVLRLGGRIVPATHLAEVVGMQLPPDANLTRLKAVVLNIGDQRIALMVDQVLEAREVVVKALGSLLGRVHGVIGATLMGDGSVVLILNPNDMLHQQHAVAPQVRLRAAAPAGKHQSEALEVLIVDDSPSVRRVLGNLIRAAGWTPHPAKDGLEALEMIHATVTRPDVILLDIEMPRMDGFEFTAALRAMHQYRRTPIIILTSRAGEKHRTRAFELGVTEYMVKPYQDDDLLGVVHRVVEQSRGVPRA